MTTIARNFARYIALPAMAAGTIGAAALGLAGMANAATTGQTPTGPGYSYSPTPTPSPHRPPSPAGTTTTAPPASPTCRTGNPPNPPGPPEYPPGGPGARQPPNREVTASTHMSHAGVPDRDGVEVVAVERPQVRGVACAYGRGNEAL